MKHQRIKIPDDFGTPELIKKRLEMVTNASGVAGDPSMSEHPLGVMHLKGVLSDSSYQSQRMHDAGMEFGTVYSRVRWLRAGRMGVLGSLMPDADDADVLAWKVMHETMTEAELAEEYLENLNELKRLKDLVKERQCYDVLVNVVVYRRMNYRHVDKLRTALCQLVKGK